MPPPRPGSHRMQPRQDSATCSRPMKDDGGRGRSRSLMSRSSTVPALRHSSFTLGMRWPSGSRFARILPPPTSCSASGCSTRRVCVATAPTRTWRRWTPNSLSAKRRSPLPSTAWISLKGLTNSTWPSTNATGTRTTTIACSIRFASSRARTTRASTDRITAGSSRVTSPFGRVGSKAVRLVTSDMGVLSLAEAAAIARSAQAAGRRVVFTNGVFDLLHPGHIRYLQRARALGDMLIVGVNSDRSVAANKGTGRPITPEAERVELLEALTAVDAVIVFDEETPHSIISALQPDVLVKGADWAEDAIVGRDIVEARGGTVVRVEVEPGYSTSAILQKIRSIGKR